MPEIPEIPEIPPRPRTPTPWAIEPSAWDIVGADGAVVATFHSEQDARHVVELVNRTAATDTP